jgi:sterol desaturase/sphingolipid hydroxylase (fatty acid hydroxylase superfamily)
MFNFASQELLILYSTPVYIFIILFEIIAGNLQQRQWYSLRDTLHNLYLMLINSGFDVLIRIGYILILAFFWDHKALQVEKNWLYWLLLVIAIDFLFYWMHRLEHSVRLFWAVHVTHHSSEKFNLTVGFRSSVFQPLYRFVFFVPLVIFGFHPVDIVFIYSACQIWGILVHTEMVNKLGWLEYFFVTPSHHRVHHASNPLYLDKNLGMFLIFWDKMFGTFQPELTEKEYQPIRYGLTSPKQLSAPLNIVLHEWNDMLTDLKKEISMGEKLNYVFGPPGWSHDGSRLTSEEMRKGEQKAES